MSLNKIGLGGILTFNSRGAVAGMGQANRAFGGMRSGAKSLGPAFTKVSTGMASMAFAAVPIIAIGKKMGDTFVNFDEQMTRVAAKMGATKGEIVALRTEAKRLGAATSFTATEAAQGLELLAQAGFNQEQQIGSLEGVLRLAEAGDLELARAAEIAAGALKGMGLSAASAEENTANMARVTNSLAFISTKTMTNVDQLGEGLKFIIPGAKNLGLSIEQTSSLLGLMGDSMLNSGMAGRNLNSLFTKMIKPGKKLNAFFKQAGFDLVEFSDGGEGASNQLRVLVDAFEALDKKGQLSVMAEFGARGAKAFSALKTSGIDAFDALTDGAKKATEQDLVSQIAKTQLDNFKGQMKLLVSATEGFIIEIGETFSSAGAMVTPFTNALSGVVGVLQGVDLGNIQEQLIDQGFSPENAQLVIAFGQGVRDGLTAIKTALSDLRAKIAEGGGMFAEMLGPEGFKKLGKAATIFAAMTVAIAPVIGIVGALALVVGSVLLPAIEAIGAVISAVGGPALIVLGALAAIFGVMRNEGETFGQTMTRIWGGIKEVAMDLWQNVLQPLWLGIRLAAVEVFPMLMESGMLVFATLREAVNEVFALWNEVMGETSVNWVAVGSSVVKVIGFIVNSGLKIMIGFLRMGINTVRQIRIAFQEMTGGSVLKGILRLGQTILNVLLLPIRTAIGQLISLFDAIPDKLKGGLSVPQSLRTFAEQGITVLDDTGIKTPDVVGAFGAKSDEPVPIEAPQLTDVSLQRRLDERSASISAELGLGAARERRASAKDAAKDTKVAVDVKTDTCVQLDGKTVGRNQQRHQQDLKDRAGFTETPRVRRISAEQGFSPG